MSEVTIIGIDFAKRVFQLHGAGNDGSVVLRKKLSRPQLLAFIAQHLRCVIAMEACATAHGWSREFEKLGMTPPSASTGASATSSTPSTGKKYETVPSIV